MLLSIPIEVQAGAFVSEFYASPVCASTGQFIGADAYHSKTLAFENQCYNTNDFPDPMAPKVKPPGYWMEVVKKSGHCPSCGVQASSHAGENEGSHIQVIVNNGNSTDTILQASTIDSARFGDQVRSIQFFALYWRDKCHGRVWEWAGCGNGTEVAAADILDGGYVDMIDWAAHDDAKYEGPCISSDSWTGGRKRMGSYMLVCDDEDYQQYPDVPVRRDEL